MELSQGQKVQRASSLALIVTLLMVLGCAEGRAKKLHQKGLDLAQEGDLKQAIVVLERVAEKWPKTEAASLALEDANTYRNLDAMETNYPSQKARLEIVQIARSLDQLRYRTGRYPTTLSSLEQAQNGVVRDPWGVPYRYARTKKGRGYRLVCLGEDGAPGGAGFSEDILIENGSFVSQLSGAYP